MVNDETVSWSAAGFRFRINVLGLRLRIVFDWHDCGYKSHARPYSYAQSAANADSDTNAGRSGQWQRYSDQSRCLPAE